MSEVLRVALAVEGRTDSIILEAILERICSGFEFVVDTLQPEESKAFPSRMGSGGWSKVYRWCRQSASEGEGSVSDSSAYSKHDVLVVHVDADVAGKTYASGNINDAPADDLPCEKPCPPARATADALRTVVLGWLGEAQRPPRLVLCTPSKAMEAWVLAAIWPSHRLVQARDWECRPNPGTLLAALPKRRRLRKRAFDYRRRRGEFADAWPDVAARLTEAGRFESELRKAVRHRDAA